MTITFETNPEVEKILFKMSEEDRNEFINNALLMYFEVIENKKEVNKSSIAYEKSFEIMNKITDKYDLHF